MRLTKNTAERNLSTLPYPVFNLKTSPLYTESCNWTEKW